MFQNSATPLNPLPILASRALRTHDPKRVYSIQNSVVPVHIALRSLAFLCTSVGVSESVGKCSINCSNSYEPLCAGNSSKNQTFHNSCVFITYQCLYPEKHYMKLKDVEPNSSLVRVLATAWDCVACQSHRLDSYN
uniref:Kazal-like domain-containing protein n=1 Tax=Timema cristinae TaxID=61476 RepID=A0A7R9D3Y2_TIMCR|nr:unnamed protein product [Timema cristinae]